MKSKSLILFIALFALLLKFHTISAQNKISLVRYNDDFSQLKIDSSKKGLQHLKYISLGKQNYISFGGELREQFQRYNNINFGDVPPNFHDTTTNQLWHRLLIHSNVELGTHFRVFVQLNNTLRFLNHNPVAPEIDENQLSLHQAFAEVNMHQWKVRVGRQEMYYGNHRLVTVREGPNTRKTFDGIVLKSTLKNGSIDLIATTPVTAKQGIFDDESFKESLLGFYGSQYLVKHKIGVDYYGFNFQSSLRKYNYTSGFENRQTYGTRIFSNFPKFNFEVEGAYQSGKFDDLKIDAYSVVTDLNVLVLTSKKGIVGFAANVASGDKNSTDKKVNTYNLLFAKPAYGLAIPIGSTNMLSLSPYIKINPVPKLNVLTQVFFLSRNSSHDGTYSPGMIQNRPKPGLYYSSEKTLGTFYLVETNYQQTKNLSFSLDASYFKAGSYPKATGSGKDITYLSFKSTFKF